MYKIIHNNNIIDVVEYPLYIRFYPSGDVSLTDKSSAHGIIGSDKHTLYSFKSEYRAGLKVVSIEKINEEEFKRLASLLNSGNEIMADESALNIAKNNKIIYLSNICKNKITSGFTVTLSDGDTSSFKLTVEDQLNLMTLENQLNNSNDTYFIYHATDQPCKLYLKEDMIKIINAARQHTLYHTTYFNVAKQFIRSLTDIEKVSLFMYGDDVSEVADNIVLKQILKNGDYFQ